MKTLNNSTVYSVFIILVAIFFISAIDQQSEASTDNQKKSVVIFLKDNLVIAQDREGKVIADGKAGIDDTYSDDDSIETRAPRLIFFSQSMFHGWMNNDHLFDLIHLKDVDSFRGVHFADCRITSGQNEHALLKAINSRVTVSNSIIGISSLGAAKYGIHGTKGAKIKAIGNTFQGGDGHVLFTQDSEIIFSQNTIVNDNLNIKLAPASNSIITQNRFESEANDPIIWIADDGQNGSYNIVISNNIFKNSNEQEAVNISPLSITGIMVHYNIYEKD